MTVSDKYGKEAYKIVLDLELVVADFKSRLDLLIEETALVQELIENLDTADPNSLQSQLNELSSTVSTISNTQSDALQNISSLNTTVQELGTSVLNLQSQLLNFVTKTTKINNKPLSSDINLTYQDVGLVDMAKTDVDDYYDN